MSLFGVVAVYSFRATVVEDSTSGRETEVRAFGALARIAAVAALYFVAAKVALLVAIPPGFATAVWPAAGVALAGVLVYGPRVAIGVLVGSFVANGAITLDDTSFATLVASSPVPLAIAAGAALQAITGAFLIKRFVGFPSSVDHLQRILGTMALGGPVASVVSATIANVALFVAASVAQDELLRSWSTWWLGDSLGVLVVIPLVSIWKSELRASPWRARAQVFLPVLAAIALTVIAFLDARRRGLEAGQAEFERRAEIRARTLEQAVLSKGDILTSIVSLFEINEEVDRAQFKAFVDPILSRHSELHGLSWNPVVRDEGRAEVEELGRTSGYPDFRITERSGDDSLVEAVTRDYYVVITYIEPFAGNEEALGFDLNSGPLRSEALAATRDSGEISATAPIVLVQETEFKPGFLLFAPIYRSGSPRDSAEARRRDIAAFVSGVFRMEPLVTEALRAFPNPGIQFDVVDVSGSERDRVLYTAPVDPTEDKGRSGYEWSTVVPIAGRCWQLNFRSTQSYPAANPWSSGWVVLAGGLLFSSFLGVFLLAVVARSAAVEDRLRLDVKVREAQKLESLGLLAGGIAHDFNNHLVGVMGNAELVEENLAPDSPLHVYLQDVKVSAQRSADLANQLLAYSGKGRFVVETVDINELVLEMSHLASVAVDKKVTVDYDLADDLPPIRADATQIRQIVQNLITNSSEAIGDRVGAITVTTGETRSAPDLPQGGYVFFEVADTGCGMDEETRAKIFDPFYTTKFTGRGLGLAAVLGIVRGHEGSIEVESEPGTGTVVRVVLPAVDEAAPQPKAAGRDSDWSGEGAVLLVDDEELVRSVGRRVLERLGFEVIEAVDGREAVERYKERAADIVLVLLDLAMPKMSGEEALAEMRKINPEIKVMLSSGYDEQESTSRLEGLNVAAFVQKPYRLSTVREKIRTVLGG